MKKIILSAAAVASIVSGSLADTTVPAASENSFLKIVKAKGDLRLRHEIKDEDGSAQAGLERFRFRYNLDLALGENMLLETAVSSGRDNPTSGNEDFVNGEYVFDYFADTLKLDIADIKYSMDKNSWLRVGKSKHHIYRPIKTQLVWDNDIRLEGINYGFKDDNTMIRLGANRVHREVEPAGSKDINMFIAQYVNTQKLDNSKLNLGAAYYLYDGVKGNRTPYGKAKGNSVVDENIAVDKDTYTEDYGILETFAEVKYKDVMGMPLKAAVTLAYNTQASDDNFGYDVSAELGATKNVGDWKAAVTYRDIQKDAVFGAHNDSDFSGGGTNSKGYFFKTKYKFAKNVDVAGWWNWSKLGDSETDYHRTQLDVILKF